MSRGAVPGGWCPVDDRVYHDAEGVCPDCGTALVETPSGDAGEASPVEREATGSPVLRGAIVLAVVGAFLLGLSFQRGKETGPERPVAKPRVAVQDVKVGATARAVGGELRMDRLIQEGDAFTATFVAGRGFPDPQLVRGVAVEVSTLSGNTSEVFGVADVRVTRLAEGFLVGGRLESGSGKIVELQVSSVQLGVGERPSWPLDISTVWPVKGAEPSVLRVGQSRPVGDGSIRLVSIVAWRDRLEIAFELRGIRAGDTGNFAINEIEVETLRGSGADRNGTSSVLSATVQEQISPSQIVARFEGVPPGVGPVVVRASRLSRFLAGPWTWRIG